MRLPAAPRYRHSDENVLPLINIVFLLLIFFMVAGILARPDPLPLQATSAELDQISHPNTALLLLDADGQWALGDTLLAADDIPAAVAAQLEQTGSRQLQLKVDAAADSALLARMLPRLRAAGAERLELLTLTRSR